jgi:hypothetical protein
VLKPDQIKRKRSKKSFMGARAKKKRKEEERGEITRNL